MVQHDVAWKIVVGGEGGVGKTTIINKYLTGEFTMDTKMTIGVQFHLQHLEYRGKKVAMNLWDLGGQERFACIIENYCIGAHGAFILFDMTRPETLLNTVRWKEMFMRKMDPGTPVMLVGTKYDVVPEDLKEMITGRGEITATQLKCSGYAVTSAMLGYNVEETIRFMLDLLFTASGFD